MAQRFKCRVLGLHNCFSFGLSNSLRLTVTPDFFLWPTVTFRPKLCLYNCFSYFHQRHFPWLIFNNWLHSLFLSVTPTVNHCACHTSGSPLTSMCRPVCPSLCCGGGLFLHTWPIRHTQQFTHIFTKIKSKLPISQNLFFFHPIGLHLADPFMILTPAFQLFWLAVFPITK